MWKSICQHLSLLRMWGPAKECMQLRTMQRGAKSFWLYKVHERDAKLHKPQVYSDFRINIWQSKIWKQNKNTFWQIFKNLQKEVIQVFLVIKWHIDNLLYEIDVNIFAIFAKKIRSIEQLFGSTGREKSCSPHLMGPNCQIVPISTHYQKRKYTRKWKLNDYFSIE